MAPILGRRRRRRKPILTDAAASQDTLVAVYVSGIDSITMLKPWRM